MSLIADVFKTRILKKDAGFFNYKVKILIASILIAGLISYLPALRNGFVNWDDIAYVSDNKVIQDFSLRNTGKIFTSFFHGNYQPVTMLTYMLEFRFFKLSPFIYHFTNLTLHLFNSLLVFLFFRILSKNATVSAITAILFSIHPLGVESVAWVSERKNVLYAFFFLNAIICYCYYLQKDRQKRFYYFSLILFFLSLLSKSMAMTLPLILFIIDYFLNRKFDRNAIIDKIPFFELSFIIGVVAIWSQYSIGDKAGLDSFNLFKKIGVASFAVNFYLYKLLVPVKLSCLYPYSGTEKASVYILSFFALLFILVGFFLSKKYTKKIIFASLFFVITLLPVLQIFPIGRTIVADRYMYISSLGFFYIISEAVFWLFAKGLKRFQLIRNVFFIILVLVIPILSFLTWNKCKAWKDSISLWSDVLNNYPNIALAYNNRGGVYSLNGELAKAISDFNACIKLDPYHEVAYLNRALTYYKMGNLEAAISDLTKALEIVPDDIRAYESRAFLYMKIGEHEKARKDIAKIKEKEQNLPKFLLHK